MSKGRSVTPDGPCTVTVAEPGHPPMLRLRPALLRVIQGPDQGREVKVSADPVTIGTHRSCDLVLTDPAVSSRHVEIVLRSRAYLVRDLGSKNGVLLNNVPIEQAYLSPGAVLRVGQSTLEALEQGDLVELPLSNDDRFGRLVGHSLAVRRLMAALQRVAKSDLTVLLEGETGTGKGLVAEELHRHGQNADGPFEVVDCGALPANLIESELFGHEKGAFTGAQTAREGAAERAAGGTLFIDEIGELELSLQPKLLRLVESRQFTRVGGSKARRTGARFVVATNRRLEQEVAVGRFRKDLFYRVAVLRIQVPPLRERLVDLPALVEELVQEIGDAAEPVLARIRDLIPLMSSYGWPGNVRELRNVVERLSVLPTEEALPAAMRPAQEGLKTFSAARDQTIERFERTFVRDLLRQCKGNVTRAAELGGVSRRYLTMLMTRHDIDRNQV